MHTKVMQLVFNLSVQTLYVPFNVFFLVMSGRLSVFLYLTRTKKRIKCLAQGHKTTTPVSKVSKGAKIRNFDTIKYHT